jgi:hypothetical protein
MLLQPLPNGSAMGTGLIFGLANALAIRCWLTEQDVPTSDDLELIAVTASETLNVKLDRSNNKQRVQAFHEFCEGFFYDMRNPSMSEEVDEVNDVPTRKFGFHDGIPVPAIALLSASTFGVSKLPMESPKKRGRKAKATTSKVEDNVQPVRVDVKVSPEDPEWIEDDQLCAVATANLQNDPEEDSISPWD